MFNSHCVTVSSAFQTIIQIREIEDKSKEYYVHYSGLNRRLDQWVAADQILSANTIDDDDTTSGDSKSEYQFSSD